MFQFALLPVLKAFRKLISFNNNLALRSPCFENLLVKTSVQSQRTLLAEAHQKNEKITTHCKIDNIVGKSLGCILNEFATQFILLTTQNVFDNRNHFSLRKTLAILNIFKFICNTQVANHCFNQKIERQSFSLFSNGVFEPVSFNLSKFLIFSV